MIASPVVWTLVAAASFAQSYTFPTGIHSLVSTRCTSLQPPSCAMFLAKDEGDETNDVDLSRRRIVHATISAASIISPPRIALALKPRNEQLCGTGLFTNYLEYRCTDLGDISDEGHRTSFSAKEEGVADSLLGKLNLDLDSVGASDKENIELVDNQATNNNMRAGDRSVTP